MIFNYAYGGIKIVEITINGVPNEVVTLTPKKANLKKIEVTLDNNGTNTLTLSKDTYTLQGSISKKALESVTYSIEDGKSYNMWGNGPMAYWFGRMGSLGEFKVFDWINIDSNNPALQTKNSLNEDGSVFAKSIFASVGGFSNQEYLSNLAFPTTIDFSNYSKLKILDGGIIRKSRNDGSNLPNVVVKIGYSDSTEKFEGASLEITDSYTLSAGAAGYANHQSKTYKLTEVDLSKIEGSKYIGMSISMTPTDATGGGSMYGGGYFHAIWLE